MRTVNLNHTVPFRHPKSQSNNNTKCHSQLMKILIFTKVYEDSDTKQHILRKIIFQ